MAASEDLKAEAVSRYGGAYNRRVAAEAEALLRAGGWADDRVEFLCTCGSSACDEILVLPLREYDWVRERPGRFLVAPGHETAADHVVRREDGYYVVEVEPDPRLE